MPYNRLNIKKFDYLIKSDINYMKGKINQYKENLINWNNAINTKLKVIDSSYVESDSLTHTIKMIMNLATDHSLLNVQAMSTNSFRMDPYFNEPIMLLNDETGEKLSYIKLKLALNLYGERKLTIIDEGAITEVIDNEGNEISKSRTGDIISIDFKNAVIDGEDFDTVYITTYLMIDPNKLKRIKLIENGLDNPVVMMSIYNVNCELEGFASLGTTSISMENSAIELTGVNMFSYPEINIENAAIKVTDETENEPIEVVSIVSMEEPSIEETSNEEENNSSKNWWEKLQDYINNNK